MAAITAALVKELRDATNVSMMECKRALVNADGDIAQATKLLREQGMAVAAKKASRTANQGLIETSATDDGKTVALIEVNCETDFVARNPGFQSFVAQMAAKANETDEALADSVKDIVTAQIAEIGENVIIKRNTRFTLQGPGLIQSYIHMGGKVGVLIEVACQNDETAQAPSFQELCKDLTLHIAACNPSCLTSDEIDADVLAEERAIFAKQAEGKPEQIIDKLVEGKLQKFYSETCLLNQGFVKEDKQSITQLLEEKSKELQDTISIRRFVRYQLGA